MNYKKIYNNLIIRGRNRILEGYYEKHRIIPKCIGGSDEPDNIVNLTPEEHYVAHQLLVKIYPNNIKLIYSAVAMTCDYTGNRINNKLFGWIKRKLSESKKNKSTSLKNKSYEEIMGKERAAELRKKRTESNNKRWGKIKNRSREAMYGKEKAAKITALHTTKVMCVETGEIFNSITEAYKKYPFGGIGDCARGINKTAGGYHWQKVE